MPEEQQGASETQPAQGETPKPLNFDEWMSGQPEPVQTMLDGHTSGLRTALDSERNAAKQMAKQLKELSGKLDQSSDAAKQLSEMQQRLESESKRADFVEAAAKVGCQDLRLAWLAASADGLTLKEVQTQYPHLFSTPRPATHAGNGAQQGSGAQKSMNDYIRRAAGRS